jgi:hypothetical protein
LWSFPPSATLTIFPLSKAFLLLVAGCMPLLPPEPLLPGPACLFTVPGRIPFPPSSALRAPCLTLFATCPYCSYCLLLSFSFFPGCGRSIQGALLIWPRVVCGSTAYDLAHVSASSQAVWVQVTGGSPGALLVSPLNMKWRSSAQSAGVERSKFCLFSVALLQGVSPVSLPDFTIGGMLSVSSL